MCIYTHTHTMIRRRPTEGTATLPDQLDNTAPQGSQLSSLIDQYNESIDPVQRISLFRQLADESEKPKYDDQIDAQSPDETLPPGAEEQAPDETLPPGVDEQINAQGPPPPLDDAVDESEQPVQKTQAQLDHIEQRRFAMASQAAYDVYYTSVSEAEVKLQRFMPAHHILQRYTDNHSTVIEKIDGRTGKQELIIAFRGTDPLNPTDVLLADTQIALGLPFARVLAHPIGRFNEAEEKYKQVARDFPKATIYVTGHSLGGSQALVVGELHPKAIVRAFNPGSSPVDLIVPNAPSNNNTRIYRVPGDPISYFAFDSAEDVVSVKAKKDIGIMSPLGGHDLDNFLPWWVLNAEPRPDTTPPDPPAPAPPAPAPPAPTPPTTSDPTPPAPATRPPAPPAPAPAPPAPMSKFSFTVFGGFSLYYEEEKEEDEEREEKCYYDYVLMKKVCPRNERLWNTAAI
ncbi:hypothetical protein [Pleurochrysis sp. Polinton-like virus]|nr:hypothetical protein [Pleurochrysis sp. Polinton-like virus]